MIIKNKNNITFKCNICGYEEIFFDTQYKKNLDIIYKIIQIDKKWKIANQDCYCFDCSKEF